MTQPEKATGQAEDVRDRVELVDLFAGFALAGYLAAFNRIDWPEPRITARDAERKPAATRSQLLLPARKRAW